MGELNADWNRVRGDQDPVQDWTRRHPVLTGCPDLAAVLQAVRRSPDPVLAALLTESSRGNQTAARVVLQAMLGKVVRMASRDPAAGVGDYVSVMWDCIRSYPLQRRPQRIAANLALDTHKIVRRESRIAAQVLLWPTEEGLSSRDAERRSALSPPRVCQRRSRAVWELAAPAEDMAAAG